MMKSIGNKYLIFFLLLPFSIFANSTEIDDISETLGHFIKEEIDKSSYNIDYDSLIKGILRAKEGDSPPLNKDEYDRLLSIISENALIENAEKNNKLGNDILLNNKKNKNIVELIDKKIQYQITSEGYGQPINIFNTPLIHIKCIMPDGSIFISDYDFVSSLQNLPEGLRFALQGMKETEARTLYIHSDYLSDDFKPQNYNSLLIFEITIKKREKTKFYPLDNDIAKEVKYLR